MVTDRYWENNPHFSGQVPGLTYVGPGRSTERPYGLSGADVADIYLNSGMAQQPGMFDKLKGWWGKNKNRIFAPGAGEGVSKFASKLTNPQFSWDSSSGISGWGKGIGKGLTLAGGVYNAYNAAKGLDNLSDLKNEGRDIQSDIVTASYNNPMLQYDLSSDQMELLRALRNGRYDSDIGIDDVDWLDAGGDALKGGLTGFLTGGMPGAIVGAVGSGANAAIGSLGNQQERSNAELQALYDAVVQSEQQYNDIKKQRAYANLMSY